MIHCVIEVDVRSCGSGCVQGGYCIGYVLFDCLDAFFYRGLVQCQLHAVVERNQ